ncbi:MAG: DUF2079 domain-containing protein [Archangium sp.]|nr:DUF2079 domain-containing protein [Archangium sp.]
MRARLSELVRRIDSQAIPAAPWLMLCALIASSVASALTLGLSDVDLVAFIGHNELPEYLRVALLRSVFWPCVVAITLLLAHLALPRAALPLAKLQFVVKLASPLALSMPALILSVYAWWADHALEFLLLLGLTTVAAEFLFRQSFSVAPSLLRPFEVTLAELRASRLLRALPLILVGAAAVSYALFVGYFTIQQHHRIQTGGFDLGHYEILMYNALHGRLFRSPILWGSSGGNNLANHAELAMLLFVPFYAIRPSGEAMLVIQAVMMGGSVIPLFLLCRSALSALTSLAICFAYLIAASLSAPLFYDFHWLPIAIPFLFLLMFALNTGRHRLAAVAFVLALLVREDVALPMAVGATYFITSRRNVKLGVLLFLAGLSWFVLVKFGVMRLAGTFDFGWIYEDLIVPKEKGVGSVAKTALTNPLFVAATLFTRAKLVFMLHLLVPLAFLPWRNWRWALFTCGGAALTLLTTNTNDAFISIRFHYQMHWMPYLYAATVVALHSLGQSGGAEGLVKRRAALASLLFASVLHSLTFGPIFQRTNFVGGFLRIPFELTDADRARAEDLRAASALIPESASVAATDLEVAQLTTRLTAMSTKIDHGSADFILLDKTHLDSHAVKQLSTLFTTEPYGLLFQKGQIVLFKRGHHNPATAAAARALGLEYAQVAQPPATPSP